MASKTKVNTALFAELGLHSKASAVKVRKLIADGADVNARDDRGNTPLLASGRSLSCLKSLLAAGARVGDRDVDGWTALHNAAYDGSMAAVKALMDHGASAKVSSVHGETPLSIAQDFGHTKIVKYLMKRAESGKKR